MGFPFRRSRLSRRETVAKTNAATRFYAAALPDDQRAAVLEKTLLPEPKARIRRPVDGRAAGRTEHQEQAAVVSWWNVECYRYNLPQFALFAIPNGGARDVITGARLKAEGVRRGIVDLCLAAPRGDYHGWYGEMKVGTNKPSPDQQQVIEYLSQAGYKVEVHWTADSAIAAIKNYLA